MVDCENGNTADLNNTTDDDGDDTANITEIMNKVKMTKMALYKNTLNDKKSACFGAPMITTTQRFVFPNIKPTIR
jgi:hypothetical protein